MTRHTAIPWHVEYPDTDSPSGMPLIMGGAKGEQPVCKILGPLDDEDGPHRGNYDLALLLAAPDLLAACEVAMVELQGWIAGNVSLDAPDAFDVLTQICVAIARAKGE